MPFKTYLTMCNTAQWTLSSNHEINQSLKIKIIKDFTLFLHRQFRGIKGNTKIPHNVLTILKSDRNTNITRCRISYKIWQKHKNYHAVGSVLKSDRNTNMPRCRISSKIWHKTKKITGCRNDSKIWQKHKKYHVVGSVLKFYRSTTNITLSDQF